MIKLYFVILYVISITVIIILTLISTNKITTTSGETVYKTSNIVIYTNALIAAVSSFYLSISGKLPDIERYIYSFFYRYPMYNNDIYSYLNAKTEIGFLLINKFFYDNNFGYKLMFFAIYLLVNMININIIFKISKYKISLLLLYFLSQLHFFSVFALKQAIAISLGNLAIYYLLKNSLSKFILFTLIACIFHTSAFVIFCLLFLKKMFNSKASPLLLLFIFILIFSSFTTLVNYFSSNISIINNYLVEDTAILDNSFGVTVIFKGLTYLLIPILGVLFFDKNDDKNKIFLSCSFLLSFSWILATQYYWAFRFSWYFTIFALAFLLDNIKKIKNNAARFSIYLCVILQLFIVFIRLIILIFSNP